MEVRVLRGYYGTETPVQHVPNAAHAIRQTYKMAWSKRSTRRYNSTVRPSSSSEAKMCLRAACVYVRRRSLAPGGVLISSVRLKTVAVYFNSRHLTRSDDVRQVHVRQVHVQQVHVQQVHVRRVHASMLTRRFAPTHLHKEGERLLTQHQSQQTNPYHRSSHQESRRWSRRSRSRTPRWTSLPSLRACGTSAQQGELGEDRRRR